MQTLSLFNVQPERVITPADKAPSQAKAKSVETKKRLDEVKYQAELLKLQKDHE